MKQYIDKQAYRKALKIIILGVVICTLLTIITGSYSFVRIGIPLALIYLAHYSGRYEGNRKTQFKARR